MRVLLALCVLFFLAGCIGSSFHRQDKALGDTWLGHTRDELIVAFGGPSYSTKLDSGLRLMEYAHHSRTRYRHGGSAVEDCITRFWLQGGRVVKVTMRGDTTLCGMFLESGQRSSLIDLKD